MTFKEWLDEIEVFASRRERLYGDFPEIEDKEKLLKWLEVAYEVENESERDELISHLTEMGYLLEEATKGLEYYAGEWVDDKTFVRGDDAGEFAREILAKL